MLLCNFTTIITSQTCNNVIISNICNTTYICLHVILHGCDIFV